jgi:hypothetical protein
MSDNINWPQAFLLSLPSILAFLTSLISSVLAYLAHRNSKIALGQNEFLKLQGQVLEQKSDTLQELVNGELGHIKNASMQLMADNVKLRAMLKGPDQSSKH